MFFLVFVDKVEAVDLRWNQHGLDGDNVYGSSRRLGATRAGSVGGREAGAGQRLGAGEHGIGYLVFIHLQGFTAGGFIYIAVAGVLPQMHDQRTTLGNSMYQLIFLILGMLVALGISLVE